MDKLKLGNTPCHENILRYTVRDFRSKTSILELQLIPLRHKDNIVTRIDVINAHRKIVHFGPNGMIKSISQFIGTVGMDSERFAFN